MVYTGHKGFQRYADIIVLLCSMDVIQVCLRESSAVTGLNSEWRRQDPKARNMSRRNHIDFTAGRNEGLAAVFVLRLPETSPGSFFIRLYIVSFVPHGLHLYENNHQVG